MLAEKIFATRVALNELGGRVGAEEWERIKGVVRELKDAQDQAYEIENRPLEICETPPPAA